MNRWGLNTIWTEMRLRKMMTLRKMSYFGHARRRGDFDKEMIQESVEGREGKVGQRYEGMGRTINGCGINSSYETSKMADDHGSNNSAIHAT